MLTILFPTESCATVSIPETLPLLAVINPTVVIPDTSRFSDTNTLFTVASPAILVSPRTSNLFGANGTDVPIPTNPFAFTTNLLLSICTPFLKLNDFLIFAIIISFRVIYRIIFVQVHQPCRRVP